MSRSFKLPIYKDKGAKSKYWKWIRSRLHTELKSQLYNDLDNLELPNPKTIINDYDYCDFIFDYRTFKKITKSISHRKEKIVNYRDIFTDEITNKMSRK